MLTRVPYSTGVFSPAVMALRFSELVLKTSHGGHLADFAD
jgi:hypothetical protein